MDGDAMGAATPPEPAPAATDVGNTAMDGVCAGGSCGAEGGAAAKVAAAAAAAAATTHVADPCADAAEPAMTDDTGTRNGGGGDAPSVEAGTPAGVAAGGDANTADVGVDEDDGMPITALDMSHEPTGGLGVGYTLPETLEELDCTNNRITSITPPPHLPALRVLTLRQNAIAALPPLPYPALTHLDLYLNALTSVTAAAFPTASRLEMLDLSFNSIKSLAAFPDTAVLPALRELFLIRNRVSRIRGLRLAALRMLELGDNRLRAIDDLSGVPGLTSLWLGRNKITKLTGLDVVPGLAQLGLQSNRLTSLVPGLAPVVGLRELYVSHNGLTSLEGIGHLTQLHTLDVASNRIEFISDMEALVNLREFWVNNNRLASFDNLATLATTCPALATVYLEGNPLADDPDYAARSLSVLPPALSQLDALPVGLVRRRLGEGPAALALAGIGRVAPGDAPADEGGRGGGGSDADAMAPS